MVNASTKHYNIKNCDTNVHFSEPYEEKKSKQKILVYAEVDISGIIKCKRKMAAEF